MKNTIGSKADLRVAAVQMCAKLGDIEYNLGQAASLTREAFRRGARWVVLPEFFTSAMAFTPSMLASWRPLDGLPLELMRDLAREGDGIVCGSFLAKDGADCFNGFLIVFPDGSYFRHNKDIPTMWENCYYVGGSNDDRVLETPAGPVGVAMCWEMIRSQTARRLAGNVDLIVGGSCWWAFPQPVPDKLAHEQEQSLLFLREAPRRLATRVGAPMVHASHAGAFEGLTPNAEAPYVSHYLGETQIVDGHGRELARLAREDGEGVILAEITPGPVSEPCDPIPDDFWTVQLFPSAQKNWQKLNPFGEAYYKENVRPLLADATT